MTYAIVLASLSVGCSKFYGVSHRPRPPDRPPASDMCVQWAKFCFGNFLLKMRFTQMQN